jgi:hypothetical protein
MTPKLTPEQSAALRQFEGPMPIEDEQTSQLYFLIDARAWESLRREQDLNAIREGIANMEAGRVAPLNEVMARIRASLGLPLE